MYLFLTAADSTGAAGGGASMILMFVVLIAVFYFFMIRPENKPVSYTHLTLPTNSRV